MMKVKITKNIVGPLGSYKKGKVYEVTDERAKYLISCNFCTVVEETPTIEKAVNTPAKTTRKTKTTKAKK